MTITSYGNIGTFLFWTGVVTVVASIAFFLFACRGISIGDPDGLHLHDTYYVLFNLGHRLVLLLPLIAGLLLVLSGLLIRSQVPAIGSEIQRIKEADQAGSSDSWKPPY